MVVIVCVLCLLWGAVVEGVVEALRVSPVDPLGGREFDMVETGP